MHPFSLTAGGPGESARSGPFSEVQPENAPALVDPLAVGHPGRGRRAIQDRQSRWRVEVLVERAEERLAIDGPLAGGRRARRKQVLVELQVIPVMVPEEEFPDPCGLVAFEEVAHEREVAEG